MSDPWTDARPELWRRLNNNDINGVHAMAIGMLKDADALLAVVPLVNEAVDAYELPIDVEQTLRDWLAALPEHLKRAP